MPLLLLASLCFRKGFFKRTDDLVDISPSAIHCSDTHVPVPQKILAKKLRDQQDHTPYTEIFIFDAFMKTTSDNYTLLNEEW